MAEENPYAKYRNQAQPVPILQLQPIIGAKTPEELARQAAEDERKMRDEVRAEEAAARAARGEERAQAEFEGTGGKPTEAQAKVSTLLTRIQGGFQDIMSVRERNPDAQSPGFGETLAEGVFGEGMVSRGIAGADRRIVRDAQRDVLDALLTLGTGAAYNAEQLEGQTVSYFPRFGDTPEEIQAKNDRLQRLIEAAKVQAGPKWAEIEQVIQPFMSPVSAPPAGETGGNAIARQYKIITPEESAAIFGEARFDAEGNAVGRDYEGETFLADGSPGPLMGRIREDMRNEMGILDAIGETFTGNARETAETEATPDAMSMPELNSFSIKSALAGLGTMVTSPQETVQVIQAQFPGVQVRQDEKGNFFLRSSIDGQEYVIKPGFTWSDVPRAIGAVAAFTPAGRATTAGGAALSGGITQAAIEGTQAATGGQFDSEEVLLASGGNVLGQQAGRAFNAVQARRAPAARSAVARDAPEIVAAGQAENVPVMTSDVRPPRTWFGNWLRSTGEKLPVVGTGGQRAAQQESRVAMIERLADEYTAQPAVIDDVTADFMKTRRGEIAKFTEQKREVFSSLAGAPPPVAQNSLDALDMAIGRFGQQETYAPLVARIQGWRNDLSNARSIQDIEDLRKAIGDTFQDESMKSSSTALRGIVNGPDGLYAAIKNDMGKYIRDNAGEQGFAKWSASNAKLADFADDLEKSTLDRVLKRGEATPEEAASLLFSKRPSDVKALFRNLSPEGQKRARSLVIQKLVDDAGGIEELSTAKFRNAMARSAESFGVIFPKEEADRLAGMLRLLQSTRRAEQASVTTPTGQSTLPFVGAGGLGFLAADWFGAAGVGVATMAAFRGYESKAMRNLLVSLSKTQPGSKAESNILGNISKAVAKAGIAPAAATQATQEQQPSSTIEVR